MDTNKPKSPEEQSSNRIAKSVTRRRFSKSVKREMVEATLDGKISISVVARQYDVNANQLFRWRKQYHEGLLDEKPQINLLPIEVTHEEKSVSSSQTLNQATILKSGSLDITLSNRHRVVITGTVCQQSLQMVLQVLS